MLPVGSHSGQADSSAHGDTVVVCLACIFFPSSEAHGNSAGSSSFVFQVHMQYISVFLSRLFVAVSSAFQNSSTMGSSREGLNNSIHLLILQRFSP